MAEDSIIDYVLVYENQDSCQREKFEAHLVRVGLILSTEKVEMGETRDDESAEGRKMLHFVKIHASNDLLEEYCERLKIKMPMKNAEQRSEHPGQRSFWSFINCSNGDSANDPSKRTLRSVFSKAKRDLFDTERIDFFTPTIRIEVVNHILNKTLYLDCPESSEGGSNLQKLLVDKVYKAAYPLHAGSSKDISNERAELNRDWATMTKWNHEQPLDKIKEYFGVQIGLYFAWLGFYTKMLVPLAIVGVVCFFYGLIEVFTDPINAAIKNSTIEMCPQCDNCATQTLAEMFPKLKWRNLFDNKLFPFFAAFVAIWSTLYFEVWKRYSARLLFRWDMTDYVSEIEPPRPDYVEKVKKHNIKKRNYITDEEEFVPKAWKAFKPYFISCPTVLFFIFLAFAAILAIKIISVVTKSVFRHSMSSFALFAPGLINLVVIMSLNKAYDFIAKWLNDREYHRTQTEYDNNLALKIYLFQFVNYYSSLFYLAFVKGNIIGFPGHYNTIDISSHKYRHEECQNGCFMELSVQLVIIMVGKQLLGAIKEMLPFLVKLWKNIWDAKRSGLNESPKRWVRDYYLTPVPPTGLFSEYLEMVIQFGFITIFAVFPLAPLCALINNIFEIRLDAEKFVSFCRRTNPIRTSSIGIWYDILKFLQKICVISNGFIIAFASSFVDKMAYIFEYHSSEYHNDYAGYLNHTLSYYSNGTNSCYYFGYRYSSENNYEYKPDHWKLLAYRLAFVVIFHNMVNLIQILVDWIIPDVPQDVQEEIKREAFLVSKFMYEQNDDEPEEILVETQEEENCDSNQDSVVLVDNV